MPTTQVQIRRDTATNLNAATPVSGELGYDTTNKRLVIGDGTAAGGIRIPNAGDVQRQTFTYGTVGGTANAITLTHAPTVTSYVAGLELTFRATATNTAATTVNVDALGVRNIFKLSGTTLVALTGNELISGAIYTITFDGTQFQLTNSGGGSGVVAVKTQSFTSSGTYTPSAGMLYCQVEAIGGGGGGGANSASNTGPGGGGGAGEFSTSIVTAATIGASQTVTIGAGGASTSNGGNTSLGTIVIANGGLAGQSASGNQAVGGGLGGSGGTGQRLLRGAVGGTGGGGNGAVTTAGGSGGGFGGGDGQVGAIGGAAQANSGGGGAGGGGAGLSRAGGAGGSGRIFITEFCSVV